eukprot:9499768-Pyramimonas_sp.AAC.1
MIDSSGTAIESPSRHYAIMMRPVLDPPQRVQRTLLTPPYHIIPPRPAPPPRSREDFGGGFGIVGKRFLLGCNSLHGGAISGNSVGNYSREAPLCILSHSSPYKPSHTSPDAPPFRRQAPRQPVRELQAARRLRLQLRVGVGHL